MNTMKAIVQDRYGDADVLQLRDIDQPTASEGEVLLRVHAASVSRGTLHLLTGEPYLLRLGFGVRRPKDLRPRPRRRRHRRRGGTERHTLLRRR